MFSIYTYILIQFFIYKRIIILIPSFFPPVGTNYSIRNASKWEVEYSRWFWKFVFSLFLKLSYGFPISIINWYRATVSYRKWKSLSCVLLFVIPWTIQPWNSLGQNTGVGSCSLLQGIFWTQESNWGLLHCRWILYQLSYQGSNYRVVTILFFNTSKRGLKIGAAL